MKVKQTFLVVTLLLLITVQANAQDVFTFSGLNWNDSVTTVNKKLKASGGEGLEFLNMAGCLVSQLFSQSCSASFDTGNSDFGHAFFGPYGLSSVVVSVRDPLTTKTILVSKYGEPMLTKSGLLWRATSGDTLQMRNSFVIYTSGQDNLNEINQQAQDNARF